MTQESAAPERILIVDDDDGTRQTLRLILAESGYAITEAASGAAALEVSATEIFDIAILDVRLPDMEGTELFQRLKRSQPDIVAIMVTAHATAKSAIRALNDGVSAYLTKPVNITEALLVVRSFLEQKRLIRENALLQLQMQVSDRMATVGTMAAGIAHEINNPLAVVIANVEYLESVCEGSVDSDKADTSEVKAALSELHEAADRISGIVRGMRTFSRADEHRPKTLDVERVLREACRMTTNEVRHRASLVMDFGSAPRVFADESRLCQVFVNLIVNAAQAFDGSTSGGNEICVATTTGAGGEAVVEVRDNGPGVAPAIRSRIFDPFFTTKPVGQGTGLGLSISERLVSAMGGSVTCEPGENEGTIFRVVLPPTAKTMAETSEKDEGAADAPNPRGRILIVDDEPGICASLKRLLRRAHDVDSVGSAEEALDILRADEGLDVILCDVMMPGMSGITFFEHVQRDLPEYAGRVVFMTGGAFAPASQRFLDEVPNHRLHKPFDAEQLRAVVRSLVAARSFSK